MDGCAEPLELRPVSPEPDDCAIAVPVVIQAATKTQDPVINNRFCFIASSFIGLLVLNIGAILMPDKIRVRSLRSVPKLRIISPIMLVSMKNWRRLWGPGRIFLLTVG